MKKMIAIATVLILVLFLAAVAIIPVACVITAFGSYMTVKSSTEERIYDDIKEIPYNRVGVLLGTNPTLKNGKPNYYFTYRIRACAKLYKAKKINKILISGDNCTKGYNEPESMKQALMKQGVHEKDIILDYAGFRTLDSIIRAREVFGQEKFTIISQQFHNERAVYLALANGMDVVAFNAKQINGTQTEFKTGYLRESLARVKMFLDIWFGKEPKFLGEKIMI